MHRLTRYKNLTLERKTSPSIIEAIFSWCSPYQIRLEGDNLTLTFDGYDGYRHFSKSLVKEGNSQGNLINTLSKNPCRKTLEEEGREMKKVCPICGKVGILQERGNALRIIHYQWIGNKRLRTTHQAWKPQKIISVNRCLKKIFLKTSKRRKIDSQKMEK